MTGHDPKIFGKVLQPEEVGLFKSLVFKYYLMLKNRFGDEIEDLYLHELVYHFGYRLGTFTGPEMSTEMEESSFSFDNEFKKILLPITKIL